jgi:Ca-activated chloride channel family protein
VKNVGLQSLEGAAIPLRGVEVTGEVLGGHAHVRVRQRYQNHEAKPVEAIYTFPLPPSATLIGFAMTCAGRTIAGVVEQRDEAFKAYDDALWAGHGAALLDEERPNVFTASVGNLLPGEETLVEIEYLERMRADEGALRWVIPTLVAPRYIPGAPSGARTADGRAEPTDRVPDADRITPRIGEVDYGLKIDLRLDLGGALAVESPSHALTVTRDDAGVRVRFAQAEVALDRDVVVIARHAADEPLTPLVTHRDSDGSGFFALTLVPDLARGSRRAAKQELVFLIDISGSMEGSSLEEARSALKLCLRHLREGDRFNIIAFESAMHRFEAAPVPFTQRTLEQADAWVEALHAMGGTELLAPLTAAVGAIGDGVVVLLTDGQVGNEAEILKATMAARRGARIYSFAIGTNVSDVLLRDLAKQTGGAVEHIYPGERIDEKVVAQFSRAIAARVTDVEIEWAGVEVGELAPSLPPPLVDGEPWTLTGRMESRKAGHAVVRGKLEGERFRMEVPLDFSSPATHPTLARLWANERIRDLATAELSGRRQERMKERIIELAVKFGVSSPFTSFVVVETRTGDRRSTGAPETRPIPVNTPAEWGMFAAKKKHKAAPGGQRYRTMALDTTLPPLAAAERGAPPPSASASQTRAGGGAGIIDRALKVLGLGGGGPHEAPNAEKAAAPDAGDAVRARLAQQRASGLWDEPGASDDESRLRATARALLDLLRAGITAAHALHGAPVKKAVEALVPLAVTVAARDARLAEFALAVAWLVSGRRARRDVQAAVGGCAPVAALGTRFADEGALRVFVEQHPRA